MSSFVHLRTHTAYSLLEGATHIKKLVKLCAEQEMPALAITDHDNLFGSLEFSLAAAGAGVQPIIGCQISLAPMFVAVSHGRVVRMVPDQLLVYAKDAQGYANLMKLVSASYLAPEGGESPLTSYQVLAEHSQGLLALTGGQYGAVGKALLANNSTQAAQALDELQKIFPDRLYMELMRHGMAAEKHIENGFLELAFAQNIPLIATNDIYFDGGREMYEAHDALMCVAEGKYVSEDARRKLTPEHRFKTTKEMQILFADIPEALENTLEFAQRCAVMSPKRDPILPGFAMERDGKILSEEDALREQARAGLQHRLDNLVFTEQMDAEERERVAKPYWERLDFELNVIIQMKFPGYFLIVSDFITWSKQNDIPVGPGRGSGAASVVAWSLLITDLDPLKYDLVFERFLNPERVSMPDFDIDFCQDRRDEVIRYVQQKYGADRVAQIITFGKLQARIVLRDVGRVLQMPYGQIDRICKMVPNNPAKPTTLQEAIDGEAELRRQMREDDSVERLMSVALKLEGLYRHASTHAAGVVIADRPLDELVALYRDPRSEAPVVQYSMKYAETAGLVKFDFLGLKTLTVLAKAVKFIQAGRGVEIDLLKLPLDDKPTYEMLARGETVGVFQFESAGMRDSLRKMMPDALEDLIALAALYRPGPMDNIPTYINCKHGKEKPDYMHPLLEPVLRETFGVIIYQEQVQRIAQVLAGYTLGGADLLRRAMGKKIKAEMDAQRSVFIEGAAKNKVDAKQASQIFDLVAKFADYGFNKAHAAAYAFIGYQTAYLKANYPVEFIAASMTYDMHNTDKLGVFREDAVRMGIAVLPPDINASEDVFAVEKNGEKLAVRYALAAIKNVGQQAMIELVAERKRGGEFKDLFDLAGRLNSNLLNRRQMENLVKAGAFDSLHKNRRQVLESIDSLIAYSARVNEEKNSAQISLFGNDAEEEKKSLPPLANCSDWSPLEKLEHEFSAVGFYLAGHPLEGYKSALKRLRVTPSNMLGDKINSSDYTGITMAGIVTGKKIKMGNRGRFAFVQLSDMGGIFETSIFDEGLLATSRDLLENGTLLVIKAEAKGEESGARIIIQSLQLLEEAASKVAGGGSLRIMIDQPTALTHITERLGLLSAKGTKVTIEAYLPETDEIAEIRLAGSYQLPPEALFYLQAIDGVREVEEL